MAKVQVFEPVMCCSTGVCGPSVDPALVRFASDMDWLKTKGVAVERANLSSNPRAFGANETVRALMQTEGIACLPLTLVEGEIVWRGVYPTREQLVSHLGLPGETADIEELPMFKPGGCC